MRRVTAFVLIAAIVFWTAPAFALTEFQRFDKHVAKSATANLTHPKLACVCQDGGPFNGFAGELTRIDISISFSGEDRRAVRVDCNVPGFNDALNGIRDRGATCSTFAVLPR